VNAWQTCARAGEGGGECGGKHAHVQGRGEVSEGGKHAHVQGRAEMNAVANMGTCRGGRR